MLNRVDVHRVFIRILRAWPSQLDNNVSGLDLLTVDSVRGPSARN